MGDSTIERKYVNAGANFGYVVSFLALGECNGFESMLDRWSDWETEYAKKGYRTVSVDDFIQFGGYSISIDHLIGKKRKPNESPVFHAQIYRENYLGRMPLEINLKTLMNGDNPIQSGLFVPPTTKVNSK